MRSEDVLVLNIQKMAIYGGGKVF